MINDKKHWKRMHIVVKYFYPVPAGVETNILETYSVLAKKGWRVNLHTSRDSLTEKNELKTLDHIRGIKIRRYNSGFFGYFPKIPWKKTDIICLHNYYLIPYSYIMIRTFFLKVLGEKRYSLVLIPHGGFTPEWTMFPKLQRIFKKVFHKTIGKALINNSVDGVRAVSVWEKNELIKNGINPGIIKIIPNGLEHEAYADIDRLASVKIKNLVKFIGKYIIQLGSISPVKNYETVIRAMPLLPADVKFVIAGPKADDRYAESLIKLTKKLKLTDRVVYLGILKGIDKYYVIKHAEMMIQMSLWESFGNVIFEGMSQGLLCIVSDNTALPFLVKDGINGYCLKARDFHSIANKAAFVLEKKQTQEIQEIINRNKKIALRNSWRSTAYTLEKFYNTLIINNK